MAPLASPSGIGVEELPESSMQSFHASFIVRPHPK
eukprot:CAMPEP_0203966590 /NCGR_PEP_ID=MMETSP0359-20131031/95781_1 /ASSEMBLY_ACC=CAM_ASM_000338 /TAXON_ID=268821 /ORGANISM="Scrippsiella Hangoei, Strain SHTV-5" /LENGTH=34 /DNA_ID= /DNA_START= /DNA_END= /DNA_ORIENTATION=